MGIRSLGSRRKKLLQTAREWQRSTAEFQRIRGNNDEYYGKVNRLIDEGLFAMVHFELLGNIYAIVVEPFDDRFIHLSNDIGIAEAQARGDNYHISIFFTSDVQTTWQHRQIEHLEQKYGTPQQHHFDITSVSGGATAVISSNDSIYKDIIELHNYGYYWNRDIHISM